MKAARFYGPGDIRVEQVPEPEPGNGQVKIKVAWNGICGSDVHAYLTTVPKYPKPGVPDPLSGESLPITLGHEFSGTIVALGPGLDESEWRVGKNVVVEPIRTCMRTSTCHSCAAGSRNLCPLANFIGIGGWGGGLAEFITVDTRNVHMLPDGVPLEIGACVEPLAVAWYAVKRSQFVKGQTALILGAGPIGLFLLKVLRSFDPNGLIITAEPAVLRRKLAVQHGATHALDPVHSDIPDEVMKLTGGVGVDVAFDAAGVQSTLDAAIGSVRPRGTVVNVAIWEKNATINVNWFVMKEFTLTGTHAYDRVHPELIEALAAGKIPGVEELITRKVAIDDVVEEGFLALINEKDTQVKILVHP